MCAHEPTPHTTNDDRHLQSPSLAICGRRHGGTFSLHRQLSFALAVIRSCSFRREIAHSVVSFQQRPSIFTRSLSEAILVLASENLRLVCSERHVCRSTIRKVKALPSRSRNEETTAHDAIKKVGPGGHYLNLRHTLEWVRKEQFLPRSVVDRQSIETWKAKGSRDSANNAAEVVDKLLREHTPEPLPSDTEVRLDDAINMMMKRRAI